MRQSNRERANRAIPRTVRRLAGAAALVGALTGIAHGQGTPLNLICLSPGDAAAWADARAECALVAGDAGFQTGVLEPCTALDGEPLAQDTATFDCGGDPVSCPASDRAWACEGVGGAAGGPNMEEARSGVCAYCPQGYHCHCTPATGTCACYIKQPKPH